MAISLMFAGLLMAQSAAPVVTVAAGQDRIDVGYEELNQGQPNAAIERIRGNRAIDANDPSALINLGTAHARTGQLREAELFYRAAIASEHRYAVQLADGRWIDSRRAARMAVEALAQDETLALR